MPNLIDINFVFDALEEKADSLSEKQLELLTIIKDITFYGKRFSEQVDKLRKFIEETSVR